jgi:SOS-response transcriptional repressor LexA
MQQRRFPVDVVAADTHDSCAGGESFALMVLGDAMAPEFEHGDIVVIEPDGLARDGSYVLAFCRNEWMLRRLARRDDGWCLQTLRAGDPVLSLPDLASVRGVVIQKSRPGRRRATKRYVE